VTNKCEGALKRYLDMEALFSEGAFLRESPGYEEPEQAGDGDFSGHAEMADK